MIATAIHRENSGRGGWGWGGYGRVCRRGGWRWLVDYSGGVFAAEGRSCVGDGERETRNRVNLWWACVLSPIGVARAIFPFRRCPQAEPGALGLAWDAG